MIELSEIDERRFKVRSARADDVRLEEIGAIEAYCEEHHVKFLISRCNVRDIAVARKLEEKGFRLMETLVHYRFDYAKKTLPSLNSSKCIIREIKPQEADRVKAIAQDAFHDYIGHYHADPRLDPSVCNEIYPDWAYNSCASKEFADAVLGAELQGHLVGFLTLKKKGEIALNAISPAYHGQGIYTALLCRGLAILEAGGRPVFISTTLANFSPQRIWARLGFEPHHAVYTFHKWY